MKSESDVFRDWVKEVDEILSLAQPLTANGQPTEYGDAHFQDVVRRLTNTSMNFENLPIFPINENLAVEMIWDEIKGKQDKQDAK
tara:strand:+ start:268 stop:522 length:255 start_codon:yes stop_codon:yes gene_type:complete